MNNSLGFIGRRISFSHANATFAYWKGGPAGGFSAPSRIQLSYSVAGSTSTSCATAMAVAMLLPESEDAADEERLERHSRPLPQAGEAA